MRLLAVDDDPVILDLLPVIFSQADMPELTTANSADSALALLYEDVLGFDGILLDIEMPEVNGIELCAMIRKLPNYRDTPILMLTSVTDSHRIEKAFSAGADDYITKPFDVKDIATRVRVAKRISERSVHVPVLDTTTLDKGQEPGAHCFDLHDSVRLKHAPQLILPFALGNYLSQLARHRLDTCTIFAAQLSDIDLLYSASRPHEFAIALSETVDSIAEVVNCPNLLMSYEGDGTFMCILQGSDFPEWPDLEDQILEVLAERAPLFDDGRPMALDLSIGNPINPNASRNQRVKKTFERARSRMIRRARSKEKVRARMERAASGRSLPARLN